MTILYINMRYLTQRITGVQRFAFELCKKLDLLAAEQSNNLQLIGLMPKRDVHAQYANYQFKQIQVHRCGVLSGHLWEQIELPYYARKHSLVNLCNSAPLMQQRQYITLHDVIFLNKLDSQTYVFRLWYTLMAKFTAARAQKIFTVSNNSKQEIIQQLKVVTQQVVVLGNAPSLHVYPYNEQILAQYNLQPQHYFLMVGSNSLRKNTHMVAQAFANNASLQKTKLVIVGGKFANLAATKQLNAPNLIYTDYISDSELRSLYHNALALIFPSISEGFGIPIIEAMAEQTPILAADIPVLHEICAASALYFNPYLVNELITQIELVLHDSSIITQLKRLMAERLDQYSWSKFAKVMLEQF